MGRIFLVEQCQNVNIVLIKPFPVLVLFHVYSFICYLPDGVSEGFPKTLKFPSDWIFVPPLRPNETDSLAWKSSRLVESCNAVTLSFMTLLCCLLTFGLNFLQTPEIISLWSAEHLAPLIARVRETLPISL